VTALLQDALQIATQTRQKTVQATALEAPLVLFAYWLNSIAVSLTPALLGDLAAAHFNLTAAFTLILICLTLLERQDAVKPPSRPATLGFALLALVPSSLVATLGMAGYAMMLARRSQGPAHFAALSAIGLAVASIWNGLGRTLFAEPLLTLDAIAVEALLTWAGEAVMRTGNIVRLENGHAIIIFADCATAFLLFPVLGLGTVLALRDATRLNTRFFAAMASLCLALIAANLLRLTLLASAPEAYAIGHGPIGQNLFDALLIGLAACAALIGRSRPMAAPPNPSTRETSPRWLAVVLMIALIGLSLKVIRYGALPSNGDDQARAVLIEFLARHHWHFQGDQTLVQSTGYSVMIFRQEGCSDSFSVSLLSAEGESVDAARAALPNAAFFYGGTPQTGPSRAAAFTLWADGALSAIGLRAGSPMPALVLAPPPPQMFGACLPPPIAKWAGLRRT